MPLLINGTDVQASLAALGAYTLRFVRRAGDLTPAIGAPPTRPLVGDFGEQLTGAPAVVGARTLRLECTLEATSATTLELAKDALVSLCAGGASGVTAGAVTIGLVPDGGGNSRQYTGYLASATEITRRDPTGLAKRATVVLVYLCPDPRAYSTTLTTVSLASLAYARTVLGAVPSRPLITLNSNFFGSGAAAVNYVNGSNTVLASCTITGTVSGSETVEVDCAARSVVHVNGGTRTPRNAWLTSGDFFALDPADAIGGTDPAIFPGGSSGTGSASYRKAWR